MPNDNINVQTFKTSPRQFFALWLRSLQPFLKLRNKDAEVLAMLLYHRYLIDLDVKNKDMIDVILFSPQTRKQMHKDLKIPESAFNNSLTTLRKKGMVIDNKVNRKIIPVIKQPFENFKLIYNFDIKDE